jgi:hypothetical protein
VSLARRFFAPSGHGITGFVGPDIDFLLDIIMAAHRYRKRK